jgi:hypothetical protein
MADTLNGVNTARYVRYTLNETFNGACSMDIYELQVFRVPQGPFANSATAGHTRTPIIAALEKCLIQTVPGGRGFSFEDAAPRTISLFSVSGALVAFRKVTAAHATVELPYAKGSVLLAKITGNGGSANTRVLMVR